MKYCLECVKTYIYVIETQLLWYSGSFTFYVDKNSGFFDPSLPPRRQFIYLTFFTYADIWKTPPSLSFVNVECESLLTPSSVFDTYMHLGDIASYLNEGK